VTRPRDALTSLKVILFLEKPELDISEILYYTIVDNRADIIAGKIMTTKDKIYNFLRRAIVNGSLNPGERIIETEISAKTGFSRGPIREAMTQLAHEGFITVKPNRGAVVSKASIEELEDWYSLLAVLEAKAAEWATPNMNTADIKKLRRINREIIRCAGHERKNFVNEWIQLNWDFHRVLWSKCGNKKLTLVLEDIRQRTFRFRYVSVWIGSSHDFTKDHQDVIDAVSRKNASQAKDAMQKHIHRDLQLLSDHYRQLGAL
jgi:DNA-binding GntR family transcriptional regulator